VLGDMGEVGDQGPAFHAEVGASARQAGIEGLLAIGPQMQHAVAAFGTGATHFNDMATLVAAIQAQMGQAGSVLVKGSRSMKMEQVVQALERGCVEGATCC
jgi:UDP-N-acetylmuramoyl-tripeptide--D-alanyl-D-alanine ligase